MMIVTVQGPIPGEEILKQGLGTFISAREHLLKREEKKTPPPSSLRSVSVGMERHDLSPINLKGLHALRLCPEALETNLSLDSIDAAVQELKAGKEVNNWVIVDCTPSQLGRNPSGLVDISVRTGIHVIMCASYEEEGGLTVEDQLRFGIDALDPTSLDPNVKIRIRCGAIVLQMRPTCSSLNVLQQEPPSTDNTATPTEEEVTAVAQACSKTGAPIMLLSHPFCWKEGMSVIHRLHARGAPLERIVMCGAHAGYNQSYETQVELLSKGVYICFDCFGRASTDVPTDGFAYYSSDAENFQRIVSLARAGYSKRILISQGVARKNHLCRYGGPGYVDIHRIFSTAYDLQYMDGGSGGLSPDDMMCIKTENALRLLNWYTPPLEVTPRLVTMRCYICNKLFEVKPGEHFSKFSFTYCNSSCLHAHRDMNWKQMYN